MSAHPFLADQSYHLRPDRGWLNDPNGMVYRNDRWHVFFQHNPDGPVHDKIHWGHASSPDLMTWSEHPVAFGPTPNGPDSFGCWSGVFVTGLDRPAVAYSGITDPTAPSTVCLRWGSEDLMTWSEPLVVAEQPLGARVSVMRDPYVFNRNGHRWALMGAGLEDGSPAVLLYRCDDILDWEFVEVWLTTRDPILNGTGPADVWECPQLVEIDGAPVLILSLHDRGSLLNVVAVSAEWLSGGSVPKILPLSLDVLDTGSCFYAPQAVPDPHGGAPLMLGWLREGDLDSERFERAGCMSLPRRLINVDGSIFSVLDEQTTRHFSPSPADVWTAGEHSLNGAIRVRLRGAGTLSHPQFDGIQGIADDEVWVDGSVLEFYPAIGSTPASFRTSQTWTLTLSSDSVAEVKEVVLSSAAPPAGTQAPHAEI